MNTHLFRSPRTWGWTVFGLAALYTLVDRLQLLVGRINVRSDYFNIFPIDGAFQLFNPLRRLADGQTAGIDFPFFHGLGTLLIHYPIFAAAGGNLHASELSREIISPVLFILSATILAYVATKSWRVVLVVLAVLFLGYYYVSLLITSNNSLLGVRSTLPLLAGAGVMLTHRWYPWPRRHLAVKLMTLAILGLAFFTSVEHGTAAIAAYLVVEGLLGNGPWWLRLWRLSRDAIIIGAVAVGCYVAVAGSHWLEPIKYALSDVPGDQFWYFGAPPNIFIDSLKSLFDDRFLKPTWLVGLPVLVVLWLYRRSRLADQVQGYLFLVVYGLITTVAMLGIQVEGYLQPLWRVFLIGAITLSYGWWRTQKPLIDSQSQNLLALGLAGIVLIANMQMPSGLTARPNVTQFTPETVQGMHLGLGWAQYVSIVEQTIPAGASLWSTYASIPEAEAQAFQPSRYDYIIHALGPERRAEYVARFEQTQPDFVQTVRYDFTGYEQWLQLEHWDFYQLILANYDFAAITPHSILWQRKEAAWAHPNDQPWLAEAAPTGNIQALDQLPVDLPDGSVVTVEIDYDAHSVLGPVPVLGKLPRYIVRTDQSQGTIALSLPPYAHRWQFPVVIKAGQMPQINAYIRSLVPGGRFRITGVRYRVMDLTPQQRQALTTQDIDSLLSDKLKVLPKNGLQLYSL
ncbi:hypothetical protein IPG36_01530 [bacterium]|nr:MAG: hypothetical protein IPG36_01530 [bacterium]